MSRSRDLANLANNATGLETITVSDITDLTATAAELNKLDGVTADTAEINKLDGVTADTAELNKLDGVTASTAELNYVDGVTSAVQTQINGLGSRTVPHIIPGVLYPAVGGNDIHGTDIDTSHGSTYTYGTAHTDGRKYYYTDIKGSKPIKDPRIGGHFGSQRHHLGSVQKLEDETATHGEDVASVDGRSWIRTVGSLTSGNGVSFQNDSNGCRLELMSTTSFIEITGYFSDLNYGTFTGANRTIKYSLDGASESSDIGATSVNTPLTGRYINPSSFVNLGLGATLGIHTIKLRRSGSSGNNIYDIELIAQDLSGSGSPNRSKIKFPAQSVISYGKKHEITETNHHYDPFNGFVNGTSLHSAFVDTATSLGLDTAPGSSAKWAISNSNNVRPYNGGRVVKWVDSSGVIKTSVNMMPPNAQNTLSNVVGTTEVTTPSATNTTPTPIFSDDALDHSQAEVAKTFHFREFGNGSANGNASYKDVSTLDNNTTDVAYVMDDGTTSYSGESYADSNGKGMWPATGGSSIDYLTFIGTGITIQNDQYNPQTITVAQNLPYGTHILKSNYANVSNATWTIDGVAITVTGGMATYNTKTNITFHQPKRPPIPEDACVIADYMLMADFVREGTPSSSAAGYVSISKGVRVQNSSRDFLADDVSGFHNSAVNLATDVGPGGFYLASNSTASANASSNKMSLAVFGTTFVANGYNSAGRNDVFIDGSDVAQTALTTSGGVSHADLIYPDNAVDLGVHTFEVRGVNSTAYSPYLSGKGFQVVTPIHTSSHYQSFETPFLHELVGGDRNMEQTNLVVSPDGKTWDQITRDTSYIGRVSCIVNTDTDTQWSSVVKWDSFRGKLEGRNYMTKDFAIAYDRLVCLRDGEYQLEASTRSQADGNRFLNWYKNADKSNYAFTDEGNSQMRAMTIFQLKRGDYVQLKGEYGGDDEAYNYTSITRLS